MSNYISNYSGSQIDNVIGLFHGKGLDQVTGLVQRNADGTFSQGSGGGSDNIFIAYSNTNYSDIKNAIDAGYFIHFANGSSSTALICPVIGYRTATYSEFNTVTIIYQRTYVDPYKLATRVYYSDNRASTVEEVSLQALLVSGTNIKTINNTSLLGSGNINTIDHIFVITPNVTTYNELLAAIQAGKYLCIHDYDNSANTLCWVQLAEEYRDNIYLYYFTNHACLVYKVASSNVWSIDFNYTILTENSTLFASKLSGTIPASVTATTQSSGDNSTKIATTAYVDGAISNLPEPMIFKGSLGTGGTITTLPTASSTNKGFTYKVITNGTYASQAAKVGDTFISDGTAWILIPSGDEPSGTVTSIATGSGLSGGPITSSGTISLATAFGDTVNPYGSKTANYVLAAPNGEAGVPTFRALVAADLPNGNWLNGTGVNSVALRNTVAQRKAQTVIGEYNIADTTGADSTARGTYAFIIGNGTAEDAPSNALTVAWNGSISSLNKDYERDTGGSVNGGIQFCDKNGNVLAYMKAYTESNSQGGYNEGFNLGTSRVVGSSTIWNTLRLMINANGNPVVTITQPEAWRKALSLENATNPSISISATTGTFVSATAIQYGKVVQLYLEVKNTSSISAGANIFEGTIKTTGLRPKMWVSGSSFMGSYSIGGRINSQGDIIIRNADSRAFSNSNNISISFMYLIN